MITKNRDYAKEVSKKVKEYFKKDNKNKLSVTMTAGCKYPYISLRQKGDEIDIEVRKTALKTIYRDDYTCNDKWVSGNVSTNAIAMQPHQWEEFLIRLDK